MLLLLKCYDRKKVKSLVDLTIIHVDWSQGTFRLSLRILLTQLSFGYRHQDGIVLGVTAEFEMKVYAVTVAFKCLSKESFITKLLELKIRKKCFKNQLNLHLILMRKIWRESLRWLRKVLHRILDPLKVLRDQQLETKRLFQY